MDCDSCQFTLAMRKEMTALVLTQLDEAVSSALKDREIAYEKDLKMRVEKAVRDDREEFRHCMHCRECRTEIKSLESERDRLKKWLDKTLAIGDERIKEIDRLKAELEVFKTGKVYQQGVSDGEAHIRFQLEVDRDLWKSLAEKLAEALRYVIHSGESYERVQEMSEAALAEFEEGK